MTPLELTALTILDRASGSTFGLVVAVEDLGESIQPALRAKQVLYRFRKTLGDPRFAQLQILLSPDNPDRELWIVNRGEDSDASPE